jgi:ATP-dependent Lon protease
MSHDTQNKSKKNKKATNTKKIADLSDDDTSLYSDDDENDKELDVHEYRKLLRTMFPSKHLENKIKAGENLKSALRKSVVHKSASPKSALEENALEDTASEEDASEEEIKRPKSNGNNIHPYSTRSKTKLNQIDDDDNYETCSDDDDDSPTNTKSNTKSEKINIVFTIREKDDEYDDDDDEDDTCSEYSTENEDDPISSDDEEEDEDNEEEDNVKNNNPKLSRIEPHITSPLAIVNDVDIEKAFQDFKELYKNNPKDKLLKKMIAVYDDEIQKRNEKKELKLQKEKERNSRIFKRCLRDKHTMDDYDFYEELDVEQQKKIIKELREINKIIRIEKPYRLSLLESNVPIPFKACALKKLKSLQNLEPGTGEYHKLKNWIDTFMRIPFGKYETLSLTIDDGRDKCHDFMENAQKTLSDAVYGLNDAKMQIMQMLGQLISNPKAIGTAIAIHGPPGTGKTSLVKEGISKILNRPFAFIALGGATDSSFLEGCGYTYEGSTWGKIVQILIDSKCMNPVIYFDELDKISDTPKGEEITNILTHLTDTSQNSQFHDKYFTELDFDLSKCLFIFSYNDESKVNPILKDRMYRIQTQGYNQKQKTVIANNYLLPKIREQVNFTQEDIIIPDQTIQYIAENMCNKEDGVRNLKRCLEIIYTKLNLFRLMRPGTNLFEENMSLKVEFPFTVTKDMVDKLVKKSDNGLNPSMYMLYC